MNKVFNNIYQKKLTKFIIMLKIQKYQNIDEDKMETSFTSDIY